jgi:hypothetical protein
VVKKQEAVAIAVGIHGFVNYRLSHVGRGNWPGRNSENCNPGTLICIATSAPASQQEERIDCALQASLHFKGKEFLFFIRQVKVQVEIPSEEEINKEGFSSISCYH